MAGGNIAAGLSLILAVIVITLLVAYVDSQGTEVGSGLEGCDVEANECGEVDIVDFIASIGDVVITGIDGAPLIVNALYLITIGGAFIAGVILLVAGAAGTLAGGG